MWKRNSKKVHQNIPRFERCPIKGCGLCFPDMRSALKHTVKVKHCGRCGFGELDLSGLKKLYDVCFACEFLKSPAPHIDEYLFH